MTPTTKLRFVERNVYVNKSARNIYGDEGTVSELVKKTILQQWWVVAGTLPEYHDEYGEWRDVPIEKEKQA